MKDRKILRIILNSIVLSLFIGLSIFVVIRYYPLFRNIMIDDTAKEEFIDKIRGYGPYSSLVIIGLQIFQTIFMVIPSGPVVMAAGVLLHPFWAVVCSVAGQTIGGIIVYVLVKWLGYKFVSIFVDPEKIKNSKLFKNHDRTKVLLAGYLLIPAMPKDILAFICPFTKITLLEFAIINTIFRLPMTIVTVMISVSIIDKNYTLAIIFTILSALMALLCFIFQNKIIAILEKSRNKKEINN